MKSEIKKIIEKGVIDLFGPEKVDPKAQQAGYGVNFTVDYPAVEKFGDYSTNVAMVLAKTLKKSPMEIAEAIKNKIAAGEFEKVEVVAPGYINFHLSEKYLQNKVAEINQEKENFGKSDIGKGIKINNEFISANPTGPLHLGNGRGGFYGDSIGRVCRKAGFEVVNEYFINDAGEQVVKLGHSLLKDGTETYSGEYIDEIIRDFEKNYGMIQGSFKEEVAKEWGMKGAGKIIENYIKPVTKKKMQIKFDAWMSEKSLYDDGYVDKAIEILKKKNLTYEQEGALWLKTTEFGDDKDRVLIKTDGQKTYFASDCGYILNKIERKFDKIIEIWGADHHGYINRFEAATKALGFSGELKFIIIQLVRLVKDGKEARMSKRAGNVVYIDELIDKVGHDVTRFFFLMYSPDTHMNFDLGLAEERSQKNPVFYVQYAHARICSILRKAQEENISSEGSTFGRGLDLLVHEKELSLIKELNKFPELVEEIAENYEVHGLPHYAIKLADKFHSFYNDCRVIDEKNSELTEARLNLINAVRIVLAETLKLIGVEAPGSM